MSRRESDDDYDNVIWQSGGWRVIACSDDFQWIVQSRQPKKWKSQSFLTSREGVLRCVGHLPGSEALQSLPARFLSRQKTAAVASCSTP